MVVLRTRPVERPPGYPAEYEEHVRLANGRRVQLRPILPSDAGELADAIRGADADTLRGRFLGGPPPLTEAVLRQLTCLDYTTHFALCAFYRGRGVAVGRYAILPPSGDDATGGHGDGDGDGAGTVAEIAVAVTPEWRRVGLATAIVERLARRASECGVTHFTALFLAENRPVEELARDGNAHVVIAEGAARLYAALPQFVDGVPQDDGVPADDGAADPGAPAAGPDPSGTGQ